MQIIQKNNTFENTQTTSFLNKLDALIASSYADADNYTHTAGGNARPTPTSADFAENIELNKDAPNLRALKKSKNLDSPNLGDLKNSENLDYSNLSDLKNSENLTGSNLSREKVLEMPPAADPEISQAELATGTHDNLPTQIQPTKITIAEAGVTATAKQNYFPN